MVERVGDAGGGRRKAADNAESLPQAIWDALNIARENKALFVAKDGLIIKANELAAQLCERTQQELADGYSITQFLESSQTRHPDALNNAGKPI